METDLRASCNVFEESAENTFELMHQRATILVIKKKEKSCLIICQDFVISCFIVSQAFLACLSALRSISNQKEALFQQESLGCLDISKQRGDSSKALNKKSLACATGKKEEKKL